MKYGFFRYRRTMARKTAGRILLAALLVLVGSVVFAVSAQLRPLLENLAVTRASSAVNRIVMEAVDEAIQSGKVSYEQLISFEKNTDGSIAAVHSNMAACNRLQAEILDIILERISQVSARELSIPIGTLSGVSILAGRGPRITVRMESIGSSTAKFQNEFYSAGINQTNHRIILYIDVSISILLPGFTTATKVSNAVTVAETVIVGSVPETYTYFGTDPSTYHEDMKDYILNQS